MIIFRSVNNFELAYFGPLFFLVPILVYGILKYKTHKAILPEGSASFEKRAFALIFDVGLLYAIEVSLLQILPFEKNQRPLSIPLIVLAVSFINMIVLPSKTGWSFGKKIFGIKIVKKGNNQAGFFDIAYREIVKSWFSLPLFYFGCFWMLIGKSKLTWHDSVADTRVLEIKYIENRNREALDLKLQENAPFRL